MIRKPNQGIQFIPYNIIEEIRSKLDIVTVIKDYITVEPKGSNFFASCPFHNDPVPSLCINPTEQFFYCFGCKATGTIINFVQYMEKLDYYQAVEHVVKTYNLAITMKFENHDKYYKTMKMFSLWCRRPHFGEMLKFVTDRGITAESCEKFQIGFVTYSNSRYLMDIEVHVKNMLELGILKRKKTSAGFNRFFVNRVIFPIHSESGKIVSFIGRTFITDTEKDTQQGAKVQKYLILPDTMLAQKAKLLYGLHLAKPYMKKTGTVVVVEGVIDLIAMSQIGIYSTVSTLGTTLTSTQARVLKKYVKKVILMYDGDEAGTESAFRVIPILLEFGFEVEICVLPRGEDPASFIRAKGKSEFYKILKDRISLFQFWGNYYATRCDTINKKGRFIDKLNSCVLKIQNDVVRQLVIKDIETITSINLTMAKVKTRRYITFNSTDEEQILRMFITNPEKREYIVDNLNPDYLINKQVKKIYNIIREHHRLGRPLTVVSISDYIEDDDVKKYFGSLAAVEFKISDQITKQLGQKDIETQIDDILFALAKRDVDIQIDHTMYTIKTKGRGKPELEKLLDKKKSMEEQCESM